MRWVSRSCTFIYNATICPILLSKILIPTTLTVPNWQKQNTHVQLFPQEVQKSVQIEMERQKQQSQRMLMWQSNTENVQTSLSPGGVMSQSREGETNTVMKTLSPLIFIYWHKVHPCAWMQNPLLCALGVSLPAEVFISVCVLSLKVR